METVNKHILIMITTVKDCIHKELAKGAETVDEVGEEETVGKMGADGHTDTAFISLPLLIQSSARRSTPFEHFCSAVSHHVQLKVPWWLMAMYKSHVSASKQLETGSSSNAV